MALETLSGLPASIVAGDTVQWTEAAPDDIDDIERVFYTFIPVEGGEGFKTGAGTVSSANYIYLLDGSQTGGAPAGDYVAKRVTYYNTTRGRNVLDAGRVKVTPDPEVAPVLSHAAIMIPLLEAFLADMSKQFLERSNVGGVEIEPMNRTEANDLLNAKRIELQRERRKAASADGRSDGRVALSDFR